MVASVAQNLKKSLAHNLFKYILDFQIKVQAVLEQCKVGDP